MDMVWKVATCSNLSGPFYSAIAVGPLALIYSLWQKTLPIEGTVGILAFNDRTSARSFMDATCPRVGVILECMATGVRGINWLLPIYLDSFYYLARQPHERWPKRELTCAPFASVACETLTPLRVAETSRHWRTP